MNLGVFRCMYEYKSYMYVWYGMYSKHKGIKQEYTDLKRPLLPYTRESGTTRGSENRENLRI